LGSSLILMVSSSFPVVGIGGAEIVGDFGLGGFFGYCGGGSQFKDKSCTRLAVGEATFLAIDSRKSRDTAKNETSSTTENSTTENQIIDRAIIRVSLYYIGTVLLLQWSILYGW
jgi:hypothetical protein